MAQQVNAAALVMGEEGDREGAGSPFFFFENQLLSSWKTVAIEIAKEKSKKNQR